MIKRTMSGKLPAGIHGQARGQFQSFMIGILHEAVDPVVDEIRSKPDQPDSIRRGYYTRHRLAGDQVALDVLNRNPNWKWKEYSTRGQPRRWPPWAPGTSLDAWSIAHGIPTYLVARKIWRYGTKGNYYFRDTWEARRRQMDSVIRRGYRRFIKEILGMGA